MRTKLLATILAGTLLTTGCTRFHVRRVLGTEGAATVELRTWADDASRRRGEPFHGRVDVDLWRQHAGHWELVYRGDSAGLTGMEVTGGTWRLEVTGAEGLQVAGKQERTFTVGDGQRARVDLTIQSFPWEAVVVVTVAVVVVAVAVAVVLDAAGGGDGLGEMLKSVTPKEAPLGVPVPPPPKGAPVGVPARVLFGPHIPIDVWMDVQVPIEWDAAAPEAGVATIATPRSPDGEVRVAFEERMDAQSFGPDTIFMVGPEGRVPAGVYSPDRGRTAVIHPLRELAPGSYEVRVDGEGVRDRDGEKMGRGATVRFVVPVGGA